MFPPSFFDQLEDRLNLAVYDTNEEFRMQKLFDTKKISREELQVEIDAGDKEAGTDKKEMHWQGETLIVDWEAVTHAPVVKTTVRVKVAGPFDRLKDKLAQASGVAGRVATAVEAQADSLIAREDQLKNKANQAFAPHNQILDQANTELDQVENALNLLSNGGPPLNESAPPAQGS